MASEPPVSPETPTPEKKSHTTRNALIIVLVIVVILALFFGLFFGLRGCDNDNPNDTPDPDEVNPDPEIVEPGPVEEPEHTHEYGDWQYDDTYHWKECECGDVIDKAEHALGEQTKDSDGNYYQTCSVCGYSTEPVTPVATYINITGADSLSVHYNNQDDSSTPETLDLRNTITVTVLDQFNNEYTGTYGSEYTLSTTSPEISLDTGTGAVTGVSEGTAVVAVTSKANENVSTTINIEVIPKEYKVESITASIIDGEINNDGYVVLAWGSTSGELQVTFTPTYATVQTYEVTPNDDTGLFTYDKASNTFTHTRLNTGTETFTITATDQSNSASAKITLECDPVIDEPYEVVWTDTLPETIAKGESITDLDDYVEVHFDHTGQDEHEYEDDTYTLSYAGSSGVSIEGTTATFTGDGGTTQYITVTATPDHAPGNPVFKQSSGITITQAVTGLSLNYSEYIFNPSKNISSVDLEVTLSPEDYWPTPEIEWTLSEPNDADDYLTLTPDDDDPTQCNVEVNKSLTSDQYIEDVIVTAAVGELTSVSCNFTINTYDFTNDTWKTIDEVSSSGNASTYYSIGDTKTITINGGSYDIRIDDFDHDDLTNTEDNGYDDNTYNNGSNKAGITVEMVDCLTQLHSLNDVTENSGGWYSYEMRSYLNSDILSTLDDDLQSVIKKVEKKSTAGNASTSLGTTASDSLFLLARVELDGTENDGYKDEGTQYAYWSEHNNFSDRIKYRNGSAYTWWLRSPTTNYTYLCYYATDDGTLTGSTNYNRPTYAYGVSFAFCI